MFEQEISDTEEAEACDSGFLFEKVLVVGVVGNRVGSGGVVVNEGVVVGRSGCGFDALFMVKAFDSVRT